MSLSFNGNAKHIGALVGALALGGGLGITGVSQMPGGGDAITLHAEIKELTTTVGELVTQKEVLAERIKLVVGALENDVAKLERVVEELRVELRMLRSQIRR